MIKNWMTAKANHSKSIQDHKDAIRRVTRGKATLESIKKTHNAEIKKRQSFRDVAVKSLAKRKQEVIDTKGKMDAAAAVLKANQQTQRVALAAENKERANIAAKMVIVRKQQGRAHHWNRILKSMSKHYTD